MPAPALKNAAPWKQIHLTGPYKNASGELVSFTENHEGIAHRVNMHDRLVEALEKMTAAFRPIYAFEHDAISNANAVLLAAKGEQ